MRRWWLIGVAACLLAGAPLREGWNEVEIRGVAQRVFRIEAAPQPARSAVLFLPGDAGYRGAAKEMAREMARTGRTVYVWDTKSYLTRFSKRDGALKPEDFGRDFRAMRLAIEPDPRVKVVLAGWSQGAAMSVAAVAEEASEPVFQGVVAMALPERGALQWNRAADWISMLGGTPGGPEFETEPYLPMLGRVPVAVIQAGKDRFTPISGSKRLLSRLRHPHRSKMLDSAGHDFGPDRAEFYATLKSDLEWIEARPGNGGTICGGRK